MINTLDEPMVLKHYCSLLPYVCYSRVLYTECSYLWSFYAGVL